MVIFAQENRVQKQNQSQFGTYYLIEMKLIFEDREFDLIVRFTNLKIASVRSSLLSVTEKSD